MSRIYNESVIICPCQKSSVDFTYQDNAHHLSTLFFCPSCQNHRCKDCSILNIEAKHCTKCLRNHSASDTYCSKNCFVCPVCSSDLGISISNVSSNGKEGKVFRFKCTHCSYSYRTSPVFQPRSLISIINNEMKDKDEHHRLFDRYTQSMQNKQKLDLEAPDNEKDREAIQRMKNLNLGNLGKYSQSISIKQKLESLGALELSEEEDMSRARSRAGISSMGQFPSLSNRLETSSVSSDMFTAQFPIPRLLGAKKCYKCWLCNNVLQHPSVDSFKFNIKWNAIDILPSIKVFHKSSQKVLKDTLEYNCILDFMNPLEKEVKINLSTLREVPPIYISNPERKVSVHLPVSEFTISGKSLTKDLIKQIPTDFLTRNTATTRAEIMMRMGENLQNRGSQSFETNFPVDSGPSWYSIPMLITWENPQEKSNNQKTEELSLKVPIYITLDTELPDSIAAMGFSKSRLKAGCWYVLDIGHFKLA